MKRLITVVAIIGLLLGSTTAVLAAYPDPGGGRTNIYLQNVGPEDSSLNLSFTNGETGGVAGNYDAGLLPSKAMKIVQPSSFPVSAGWAGSVEVQATQPSAALVTMLWDSAAGVKRAGAYKGVDAPANQAYLPWLAVRDVQNRSLLTIQNTESLAGTAIVHLLDRTGAEKKSFSVDIPPRAEKTFDLTQPQYMPDFSGSFGQGSAYVTATTKIAVVANMYWGPVTDNSADAYSGVSTGETALWFPSAFRMYNASCGNKLDSRCFLKYVIPVIQNLGDVPTNVELQFIKYDGTVTHVMVETIGPRAAQGFNTASQATLEYDKFWAMANALDAAADGLGQWRGTIKVTSQPAQGQSVAQPLAGVCVYYARNTGVRDCVMFNAIRDSEASPGQRLAWPFVSRNRNAGSGNRFSTTLLQNVTTDSGTLTVEFYNSVTGQMVAHVWNIPVGANALVAINLGNAVGIPEAELHQYLGENFVGSMYVTPSAGLGMGGVTNVLWDGLDRAAGYSGFLVPQ